jgi:hypothetical protein
VKANFKKSMAASSVLFLVCASTLVSLIESFALHCTSLNIGHRDVQGLGSFCPRLPMSIVPIVSKIANRNPLRSGLRQRNIISSKACAQEDWEKFVLDLQSNICSEAEAADGKGKFCVDRWEREAGGGYGITRVLEGGNLWEKAACSVSVVRGQLSKERAAAISARGQSVVAPNQPYFAAACSLVFHSASPMVPTFRADVRYFKVGSGEGWYGGGADLTPYYLFEEVSMPPSLHAPRAC